MEAASSPAPGGITVDPDPPRWHALPLDALTKRIGADAKGLDSRQVARRLERYGPNRSPPPDRPGATVRFLRQFHNFLIYVLLASAIVLSLLRLWLDASVVFGVTLINALIGFIQEGRAERAF